MLPGVLCILLYGVAVHVAWCTMPTTLWCCCECCLVYYAVYSMVLMCMLPGMVLLCMLPGVLYGVAVHVAWCLLYGVAVHVA